LGFDWLGVWIDVPLLEKVRLARLKSMQTIGEIWMWSGSNSIILTWFSSKLIGPMITHFCSGLNTRGSNKSFCSFGNSIPLLKLTLVDES